MEIDKIKIYTDGGSRGNPGPAAVGFVISAAGGPASGGERSIKWEKKYGEYIGITTNNEAEYRAVILALKKLKQLIGSEKASEIHVEFMVDSELLAKQFNGEYKIKDANLQSLFMELWNLKLDFKKVTFIHVLRSRNEEADKLVNEMLDKEESKLDL